MDSKNDLTFSPQQFLRTYKFVYYGVGFGMIVLLVLTYFYTAQQVPETTFTFNQAINTAIVIGFVGFFSGNIAFKYLLKSLHKKEDLKDKFSGYLIANITRYALVEGPIVVAVFFYLYQTHIAFLIVIGTLLGYYLTIRPTAAKTIMDLQLKGEDKSNFNKAIKKSATN